MRSAAALDGTVSESSIMIDEMPQSPTVVEQTPWYWLPTMGCCNSREGTDPLYIDPGHSAPDEATITMSDSLCIAARDDYNLKEHSSPHTCL